MNDVRSSGKPKEHLLGMLFVISFAERLAVEGHDGIGPEHDR